ncbi:IQ domain-containing protein K-like [Columba livia]|uniref:IQ domain-containing protein K-like n=1 Tax=Columba livia TaxID=8932 RepID=A0A2I0LL19_COLLI|nr:IQ domain-containing protein K-like [Columba livia]
MFSSRILGVFRISSTLTRPG